MGFSNEQWAGGAESWIIEGNAVRLRLPRLDDAESLFEVSGNAEVMRPWGVAPHPNVDHTRRVIERFGEDLRERRSVRWVIEDRKTSRVIGDVGFWRFVPERARGEVAAKLNPEMHARGIMSWALYAAIEFGFTRLKLHSVEANIDTRNEPAIRLVERVGFEREGRLKNHAYCAWEQHYLDTFLYSVWKDTLREPGRVV